MHLLVRETHSLDEEDKATDLGQSPAEIVLLSFSDSDLGAAASAWLGMDETRPSLRLASLARLRHPMSVDVYLENVVSHARAVIVRLLGGVAYWRYGADELAELCRREGIALAVLPGDGRPDPALDELCTVAPAIRARLDAMLGQGGAENLRRAIALAASAGGLREDAGEQAVALPACGTHDFGTAQTGPVAAIVFYRSTLLSGDIAPLVALAEALAERGLAARGIFAASLKEAQSSAFVRETLREWNPAVVLSATAFSATGPHGSPLDVADAPVLQMVLSGSSLEAWQASPRGLSQADLAMQVVLPELDGRLPALAISFKAAEMAIPELEFALPRHVPHAPGIFRVADLAAAWARLATTPRSERRVLLVLSDYPGAPGQIGHAVGLDALASVRAILRMLGAAGYDTSEPTDLVAQLTEALARTLLTRDAYEALFSRLPQEAQDKILAAWGAPDRDITLRFARAGNVLVCVEPDRGSRLDRKSSYHDPDLPPGHAYVGFHLWRRYVWDAHAIVHLGAHGALEWLPGKSVASSENCFPAALLGPCPVVYPYIVNNPGESAAARRRLGAVTIGHLTPPLRRAGLSGAASELERLIDEYAAADGLDPRRARLLRGEILARAADTGLLAEAGADPADDTDALTKLDAYLCDIKDMQIGDGLHVFGEPPAGRAMLLETLCASNPGIDPAIIAVRLDACAEAERGALLAALDGFFVPPGPAGAPSRGRADVLPTGRVLTPTDPRAMPTRAALALAERSVALLLRRHLQDHGEELRRIVLDVWGSASLRTGGEDIALALLLLGTKPLWDDGSHRVSGFEIVPLAVLNRPRVDVTLRVSGLFRDAFATQIALFDAAVRAVAARDEAPDWNPLAGLTLRHDTARVFGAAPGTFGTGIEDQLARLAFAGRAELGEAWLAASGVAYGQDIDGAALPEQFAGLVAAAQAFVHHQDQAESDLLDATHAAHEGGFAAAAHSLGGTPALYRADTSRPEAPRLATLAEDLARVVRGRAANPAWIAGQMRHDYRGAAEIARAVQGLVAFAATLPFRIDSLFDLIYDSTLGNPEVDAFLLAANPGAHADMAARFTEARARDWWRPRRNDLGRRDLDPPESDA
jgi:cobaltochelatase CobN